MTSRKLPADLAQKVATFEELYPELRGLHERVMPDEQQDRERKRQQAIRQNIQASERRARRAAICRECLEGKHGRQLRDFAAAVERQHGRLTDEAAEQIMRALNEHRKGQDK